MNKNILLVVVFLQMLFLLAMPLSSEACTVFSSAQDDKILAATNKDWDNIKTRILFLPPTKGKYGRVYFGYQVAEGFQNVGGMNDQGLWYDGASLPERSDIRNHYNKPTIEGELCEKVLEECATVAEVIEMYTKYFTPHWQGHTMWADKYGNSVIIEYGEKDVVFVRRKGNYQVMTNFYVSDSANSRWYNCYRYKVADNMLKNSSEISLSLFRSILDAVHQEGATPTLYSNIYDLKNGEIYVYNFQNYEEVVKLNLDKELNKGERYYKLPELFNQIKLCSPSYDEIVNSSAVTFIWNGNAESHNLYYSQDPAFTNCIPIEIANSQLPEEKNLNLSSLYLAVLLLGGVWIRYKKILVFIICIILLNTFLSCSTDIIMSPYPPSKTEHSTTIENLQSNTLYYWKVIAICGNGINSESIVQSFTTQE